MEARRSASHRGGGRVVVAEEQESGRGRGKGGSRGRGRGRRGPVLRGPFSVPRRGFMGGIPAPARSRVASSWNRAFQDHVSLSVGWGEGCRIRRLSVRNTRITRESLWEVLGTEHWHPCLVPSSLGHRCHVTRVQASSPLPFREGGL